MSDIVARSATSVRSAPIRMTFEEYLTWDDEGQRAEWVDGELVFMSPASLDHQRVLAFLNELLTIFVRAHRLGEIFFAPIVMRLTTRPSGREPDLMFVATAHSARLKPSHVEGPADLVIEIVSPDDPERDHVEKLAEYEAGGVPEYWVVDALRSEGSFFVLGDDGRYRQVPPDAEGFYYSATLPGLRLKVEWLWQRPLPEPPDLLSQVGL